MSKRNVIAFATIALMFLCVNSFASNEDTKPKPILIVSERNSIGQWIGVEGDYLLAFSWRKVHLDRRGEPDFRDEQPNALDLCLTLENRGEHDIVVDPMLIALAFDTDTYRAEQNRYLVDNPRVLLKPRESIAVAAYFIVPLDRDPTGLVVVPRKDSEVVWVVRMLPKQGK